MLGVTKKRFTNNTLFISLETKDTNKRYLYRLFETKDTNNMLFIQITCYLYK